MAKVHSSEKAQRHPDCGAEVRNLGRALDAIDAQLIDTETREFLGADRWADTKLQELKVLRIQSLQELQESAYFGRIDVRTQRGKLERYYISRQDATAGPVRIVSWRAPIGSLFYSGGALKQSYDAPAGQQNVDLLLKRQIVVHQADLDDLTDTVDNRDDSSLSLNAEEEYLVQQLEQRGEMRLEDIIRTIQSEQDALIRGPHEGVLLIQGVAGSGKTSVAYYRLAYLLYPDNKTGITRSNALVIGPSPLFLSYTQELLPELGETGVLETTFADYAFGRIYDEPGSNLARRGRSIRRRQHLQDLTGEGIRRRHASADESAHLRRQSKIRGDTRMLRLMKTFAAHLLAEHQNALRTADGPAPVVVSLAKGPFAADFELAAESIERALDRSAAMGPIGRSYQLANEQLFRELDSAELLPWFERVKADPKDERKPLRDRARSQIAAYLNTVFPVLSAPEMYYGLLADRELLARVAEGIFLPGEIDLLAERPAPSGPETIYTDDLAAIFALHRATYGEKPFYRHIVIDEAQDLSPLHFMLLKNEMQSVSLTILGDRSQGVFEYRGLESWNELEAVFSVGEVAFEAMVRNFRSTKPIVESCNRILAAAGLPSEAVPVNREGTEPAVAAFETAVDYYSGVSDQLNELWDEGYRNVAVIAKTEAARDRMFDRLRRLSSPPMQKLTESSTDYMHEVSVLTVSDSKGLEFEAVIVVDADRANYQLDSAFDARLLYVASSRALHRLAFLAHGEVSALLAEVLPLAQVAGLCTAAPHGRPCLRVSQGSGDRCAQCAQGSDEGARSATRTKRKPSARPRKSPVALPDSEALVREFVDRGSGLAKSLSYEELRSLMNSISPPYEAVVAFAAGHGRYEDQPAAVDLLRLAPATHRTAVLEYLSKWALNPQARVKSQELLEEPQQ